jgi:hypothetical protein
MNHGGLGLIEHNRGTRRIRLLLPQDLLRTLSLTDGSTIEGIFYPGRSDADIRSPTGNWDFAFSPVPYRLWPKVGCIRARLQNEPGSIAEFANLLAKNGVSILHSEYSRSGYRFGSWNFVVVFDIETRDEDFDSNTTTYVPTVNALERLKSVLLNAPFLFAEKDDIQFRNSIDMWPLTALAYFHNLSRSLKRNTEDAWLYEPFTLTCDNGALYCSDRVRLFPAILGKLFPSQSNASISVYADISSTDVVLRTAVISSSDEMRFFELIVEYERDAPPDTSRGFCAHIVDMLPNSMHVWNLTNYTSVSTPYSELGGTRLLVECLDRPASIGQLQSSAIEDLLTRIREGNFCAHEEQVFLLHKVKARPMSIEQVWYEIVRDRPGASGIPYRYDIFFSYADKDLRVAEETCTEMVSADLKCYLANKELVGGDEFAEEIRQALIASREVVVLCSPNSIRSTWVTTEWAAAWALDKRITPFLYQVSVDQLPDRLARLHCVDVRDVGRFILAATGRKERW